MVLYLIQPVLIKQRDKVPLLLVTKITVKVLHVNMPPWNLVTDADCCMQYQALVTGHGAVIGHFAAKDG